MILNVNAVPISGGIPINVVVNVFKNVNVLLTNIGALVDALASANHQDRHQGASYQQDVL